MIVSVVGILYFAFYIFFTRFNNKNFFISIIIMLHSKVWSSFVKH